jgi:hypothetical protein
MKLAVRGWRLAVVLRGSIFCCLLISACGQLACSIPSLETPECSAARDGVKQFYSFHFGNDMHPSSENLKARERFLTPDLVKTLSASGETKIDYFTGAEDPPKTFKIGKCENSQPDKANVQVQIYWRDDARTVQKEVHVEAVKTGDAWLINKVSN